MSFVTEANERVSIYDAHALIGDPIPDYGMSASAKLHCPFEDVFHVDSGKSYRVYPMTNSSYCFACAQRFSPVLLVQMYFELEPEDAARKLLDTIGWIEPTIENRWDTIVNPIVEIDHDALKSTLEVYCQRLDPKWVGRSGEARTRFEKLTDMLKKVSTEHDAQLWLTAAKKYMKQVLETK